MFVKNLIKTKILCVCLVFFAYVSTYSQPFAGGSGTAADPYLIGTLSNIIELSDSVLAGTNWSRDKHFALINDITDSVRYIIGFKSDTKSFQGYFNGYNYKITLSLNYPTLSYVGLFAYVSHYGLIENLIVDGFVSGDSYVGGIAGCVDSDTNIIDCVGNATVVGNSFVHNICPCLSSTTVDTAYILELYVNPEDAGTVAGFGEYEESETATISATANEGFEFVYWSVNGDFLSSENPLIITVTQDTVITANFNFVSINEPTVANLQVSPNPTSNSATLTVDLATAGNLTVTVNNLLGQELLEIHSGFADTGTFTKTFSIETLPKGVYYLKITHNGNVTVEKVVRK